MTAPTTLRIAVLWSRLPIGWPRFRSIGLMVVVFEECRIVPHVTPFVYRLGNMNIPIRFVIGLFPVPAVVMAGDYVVLNRTDLIIVRLGVPLPMTAAVLLMRLMLGFPLEFSAEQDSTFIPGLRLNVPVALVDRTVTLVSRLVPGPRPTV